MINWHRVLWLAVFAFILFNTGGFACQPRPCNPRVIASCEP